MVDLVCEIENSLQDSIDGVFRLVIFAEKHGDLCISITSAKRPLLRSKLLLAENISFQNKSSQ
jgi:hypothetical protein